MQEMNIETALFKLFKKYITEQSNFSPYIFNNTPKNLSVFPTIVLEEQNNTTDIKYTTLDRQENVNNLTYRIEFYVKDIIIDGETHTSKEISNELKYLIFDFFEAYGFIRTQCTKADYTNYEVDRYIILEEGKLNNWNRKLNN